MRGYGNSGIGGGEYCMANLFRTTTKLGLNLSFMPPPLLCPCLHVVTGLWLSSHTPHPPTPGPGLHLLGQKRLCVSLADQIRELQPLGIIIPSLPPLTTSLPASPPSPLSDCCSRFAIIHPSLPPPHSLA